MNQHPSELLKTAMLRARSYNPPQKTIFIPVIQTPQETAKPAVNLQSDPIFPFLTMRRILDYVSQAEGVAIRDVLSDRRHAPLCKARQICYWLCYELTTNTYPQIGKFFKRDHTTALYAHHKIRKDMETNPELAAKLKRYWTELTSPPSRWDGSIA